jgi:hypothetical protein
LNDLARSGYGAHLLVAVASLIAKRAQQTYCLIWKSCPP